MQAIRDSLHRAVLITIIALSTGRAIPMSDEKKRLAAEAALEYVQPDSILGVGTGSTVNHFIDVLAADPSRKIRAAVSKLRRICFRSRA